ncbi:NAD(P)H-binding protein [Rhizobium sp. P38BS-XIX]|uniref:SDR family oxidoreductase n=1 Tax=Rhizobium sp. P38BS-XIX TaxID=2726740 RepID=UPI001457109C|nr:SDR family oxidoreductase [Rhizobium sp. P38BS-XIX]NLR96692.1 NAD(P)H-binding protein [Rhizobium sp. P38BS-XIX]
MNNQTANTKTALILGATGGIGGAVADGLARRGWHIRALNRDATEAARHQPNFEWIQGDAMQAADVLKAAQGAEIIVHGVNPPGYRNWAQVVLPMLDNTIAAAKAVGARIVLPGTVYNFGPDVFPNVSEDSVQRPKTRKGAIRVQMERRLKAAAEQGNTPVIIVRAGDFFGGSRANSWFSQAMVTPGKPVNSMTYPGKRGLGHQWAYLPDVAETMIRLIEKADELPNFAVYHMRGHWDGDGTQMVEAVQRVVGHKIKVRSFPWWTVPLAAPFVPFMRELREMSYLWDVPLEMRNDKLRAVLGEEPHTPIDEAVRSSLASIGCLQTA